MRPAMVPPATSTCAMIQPPKMSPFWFESAGIGMTRNAGSFPSGSLSKLFFLGLHVVQRPAAERREAGADYKPGVDQARIRDHAVLRAGPPVDDEARGILRRQVQLVDLAHEGRGFFRQLLVGFFSGNYFDQLEQRHRVEEMDADQARRILQRGGDVRELEARGVGGED